MAQRSQLPDVNEAGRVLAQLDDWRAIVFVLVFIIFILLLERFVANREMRLERTAMRELASSFAESASKVADALNTLRVEVAVLRQTSARIENIAVPPRIEETSHDATRR